MSDCLNESVRRAPAHGPAAHVLTFMCSMRWRQHQMRRLFRFVVEFLPLFFALGVTRIAGVPNGKSVVDKCGVCGGDSSSCAGCDGVPGSNAV